MESGRKIIALSCVVNHTIGPTVAELQEEVARLRNVEAELNALKAALHTQDNETIENLTSYYWSALGPPDCFQELGPDDPDYPDDGENKNPDFPANWQAAKDDIGSWGYGNPWEGYTDRATEWFREHYPNRSTEV